MIEHGVTYETSPIQREGQRPEADPFGDDKQKGEKQVLRLRAARFAQDEKYIINK
jgi:hypothetical protein